MKYAKPTSTVTQLAFSLGETSTLNYMDEYREIEFKGFFEPYFQVPSGGR